LAADWQTSVGSPVAAIFHAALGYTWLYYTSTFSSPREQSQPVRSQLIDAIALAQNEIDVTSIDGSREKQLGNQKFAHAEAQRTRRRDGNTNLR
jgi:hypothetical protein